MGNPNLEKAQHIWETFDVRILMLASLLIQILLTFLAPLRKKSASIFLIAFLWLLYLAADSVALYTIGVISRNQGKETPGKGGQYLGPTAFWAPFLLLHLGGPDTITALALQDCELWHRHALQFVTQLLITMYVFVVSLGSNKLLLPTAFMFIDGCLKYIERTCALYFASMDTFRASQQRKAEPGPNYARLMEEYSSARTAYIPTSIGGPAGSDMRVDETGQQRNQNNQGNGEISPSGTIKKGVEEEEEAIKKAHGYYEKFRGLLADSFLSLNDRQDSRDFFLKQEPQEAIRIVQIELNLIYDVFYTKVYLLKKKQRLARALSFLSVTTSLLLFSFCDNNGRINQCVHGPDVVITYVLLGGAIALEIFSFLMFLHYDWCIIVTILDSTPKWLAIVLKQSARSLKWLTINLRCLLCRFKWLRGSLSCRWSEKVSQYNLLDYCFSESPWYVTWPSYIPWIKSLFIEWCYVQTLDIDKDLENSIARELNDKAKLAQDIKDAKKQCSSRGDFVLEHEYFIISEILRPWTVDVDYDESVFTWHIATDLCLRTCNKETHNQKEKEKDQKDEKDQLRDLCFCTCNNQNKEKERDQKDEKDQLRDHCKKLSEYMLYLLVRKQALVSPVAGDSDIRFEDTCAEAHKFMSYRPVGQLSKDETIRKFCDNAFEVKTEVKPMVAKGDKSQSVLFDACRLAKQLRMFEENQWKIIFKVWVELLSYAAVRCSPRSHVAQLSKGGELITIVWLLMAHFGLGEHFKQVQGFGWAKLVISK